MPSFEVVISRYAEDLTWVLLPQYASYVGRMVVYNKGEDNIPQEVHKAVLRVESLPNVGREGHTNLYHIVTGLRESTLADITLFLPGSVYELKQKRDVLHSIFLPNLDNRLLAVNYCVPLSKLSDFQIDEWVCTAPSNLSKVPEKRCLPARTRPFKQWFADTFEPYLHVQSLSVIPAGWFGMLLGYREILSQTPLSLYQDLLDQLSTHSNPEAGHFVERIGGLLTTRYGAWK